MHLQNSDISAWCPWELGFGDGKNKKVVVLEIADDDQYKQEFLSIYPYIDIANGRKSGKMYFWVNDRTRENVYCRLDEYVLENKEMKYHEH